MKLRQKLAMVLASAMIVTAVPVTTMAASTNSLSNTIVMIDGTTVGFDKEPGTATGSTKYTINNAHPELVMKVSQDVDINASQGTTFYINAKDSKFVKEAFAAAKFGNADAGSITVAANGTTDGVNKLPEQVTFTTKYSTSGRATITATVTYLSESQVMVNVKSSDAKLLANDELRIPLFMTAKEGTPAVEIDAKHSAFSGGTVVLASDAIGTKSLSVKTADATKITIDGGKIAKITVAENVIGALNGKKGTGNTATDTSKPNVKARTLKVKLPNSSELVFDEASTIMITGKYGFTNAAAYSTIALTADGKAYAVTKNADGVLVPTGNPLTGDIYEGVGYTVDDTEIEIVLPAWEAQGNTIGEVEITGVNVEPEDRNGAKVADVKATISGDMFATVDATIATVKEFDVEFKCEPVALVAGKDAKKVTVELNELVADVINEKDEVVFTLDNGWIRELTVNEDGAYTIVGEKKAAAKEVTLKQVQQYLEDEKIVEMPDHLALTELVLEKAGTNQYHIVGFETRTTKDFKADKANAMKVKVEVQAELGNSDDINMKVENRGIEDQQVKVATVTQPATAEGETITLKVGLKGQVGGKVVVKETAKEMFARNERLVIKIADKDTGITIKDAKITANGVRIETKSEAYGGGISFEIDRASDEAAEIVIEDIKFDVDRSVPEGSYDLSIAGGALKGSDVCGAIEVKDFIKIGTKNTEDLPDAAKAKEIILAVGNKEYTVNGETKTADAAAFIDENNRTMVPVRFVAEEFGKVDFGTVNGVGTVTVFKDGDVLQFQNGSNIMNKNGIAIPMDTKVVIKDGRTYVPFKYVASGLGINYDFAADTKTITFTNQSK